MIESGLLKQIPDIRHGFFTRQGGRSGGIYASLNTGLGSNDDRHTVIANRAKVQDALGASALVSPYQVHGVETVEVARPWSWDDTARVPRADALVTSRPGLAIAVNTADCTPVLFADRKGNAVGVAHAGWKGAVSGVLESCVAAMERLGALRSNIIAVVGPTISKGSYEVGPEFHKRFLEQDSGNESYFSPSERAGHRMFDLPGYVSGRLRDLQLADVELMGHCTYANEDLFFSYRRATHRNEPDYGRQMSAIVMI